MAKSARNRFASWMQKQQLQDVQNELTQSGCPVYEVNVDGIKENHFQAVLSDELILDYENGRFQMHFTTKVKLPYPQAEAFATLKSALWKM